MGERFVQLRSAVLNAYCSERGLTPRQRQELTHFIAEADWRTGAVEGFDLTNCAQELGLGAASGRRTLSRDVRQLAELGVVEYSPARGGSNGLLRLPAYFDLVRSRSPRNADDETAAEPETARARRARLSPPSDPTARALRARKDPNRARLARADQPKQPQLPGDSRSEDNYTDKTKGGREERTHPNDWSADDLDQLLAPLVAFARRTARPHLIFDRPRVVEWLAPYPRRSIEAAVARYLLRLRADRTITDPLSAFFGLARKRPEYFTDPDVVTDTVGPERPRPAIAIFEPERPAGTLSPRTQKLAARASGVTAGAAS